MQASSHASVGPRLFWGLSSFQILALFRRGLFYAYLSVYLRYHLGLSVTGTTLFATLPMLANIASQNLLWGRLSDRYQRRKTLIIAGEVLAANMIPPVKRPAGSASSMPPIFSVGGWPGL